MLEVTEAAHRIYLLSDQPPRRLAVIRKPDGASSAYGIRAHNPLGSNWRTVYEQLENLAEIELALSLGEDEFHTAENADLEADGYTFWFSGPDCCQLPKVITRLGGD